MPFPKVEEVRNLSDEELVAEIVKVKRELFDLRMLKATGRLEKPHLFKYNRHRLAQLLTIERERELVKEAEASTQEVAASVSSTSVETADSPE
ncbi:MULTISPECIES: 50S ribosomal protein L29 [Okeania]|uniref:50S ribosomal protein L29 n=1 Tax=Okeania TaxID=1458928 RepID=UPI000F5280A5|nr:MULTISPECIES: 50S ribosomal protein L29 [Okeania]NEP04060.1 50S ribosomal protein L29 [Okeania sp. SIO4D6]NET15821.1 50S ribosomal protein L29 [Okeania sp. SIO1H6]NEP71925.1 50S ribosomal protein L29 [Okeania sp. SIO2G5]NEP88447.1 50S ribosomal protein L29 [Okeania sp. SIO2C2]NEP93030.1 50S ribosomal protein L29 [Okeania sp. SIO2F5]